MRVSCEVPVSRLYILWNRRLTDRYHDLAHLDHTFAVRCEMFRKNRLTEIPSAKHVRKSRKSRAMGSTIGRSQLQWNNRSPPFNTFGGQKVALISSNLLG